MKSNLCGGLLKKFSCAKLNAHFESELFSRIRSLEAQLSHGWAAFPINSTRAGEYESLVGEHLDGEISIDHDRQALNS